MGREVEKLTRVPLHELAEGMHNDGDGLYLKVKKNGARSWVFRYRTASSKWLRDKGLGPLDVVSLSAARKRVRQYRAELLKGDDPIETKRKSREEARAKLARQVTFGACVEQYIASQRAAWRNRKHAKQWASTLATYCGEWYRLPVGKIDTAMVMKVLTPRWETHTETATRVRQRIERVLDWAAANDYRSGDNPARWRGHLSKLLAPPEELKNVQHRPALPHTDLPKFMQELGDKSSLAAKALTLQILTAARPGEAVGARWSEFDLTLGVWTIPKGRMKSKRFHKIPLSPAALALVQALDRASEEFLFPGPTGKPLTTAATLKLLRQHRPDMTCHGFRSTFRDWAAEISDYDGPVAEAALAHGVKDQTVAAYLRTTYFDKRKLLMAHWEAHCLSAMAS